MAPFKGKGQFNLLLFHFWLIRAHKDPFAAPHFKRNVPRGTISVFTELKRLFLKNNNFPGRHKDGSVVVVLSFICRTLSTGHGEA